MPWIRRHIVLVSTVVSALTLGALVFALVQAEQGAREDARTRFVERTRISGQLLQGTITSQLPTLGSQAAQAFNTPTISKRQLRDSGMLSYVGEDGSAGMAVIDARSHRVLGSAGSFPTQPGSRISPVPAHVAKAIAGTGGVSGVIAGRGAQADSPALELAVPFGTDFGARVVVLRVPTSLISLFFGSAFNDTDESSGTLTVVDDRGRPLINGSSGSDDPTAELAAIARSANAGDPGPQKTDSGQLVVAIPFEGAPWTLIASASPEQLYGSAGPIGAPLSIAIVLMLLGAAAGMTLLLRRTTADSRRLDSANADLERRNQEVVRANKAKSEFLANMSHELRTPLNGIIGFSELMHDGKLGEITNEQREYLGDVLSSAEHLRELIESLLDLSKIEAGRMEFRPQPVNPGELAEQVAAALTSLAARRDIEVEVIPDPDPREARLDPGKLRQVLYNLISNAIKYNREGGSVEVTIGRAPGDRLRIVVKDTGIGIADADLPRLFKQFEQLDAGIAKGSQGTGLGLALSKRIVEEQGGSISVESTLGEGSRFEVLLPLDASPAEPAGPDANGAEPAAGVAETVAERD